MSAIRVTAARTIGRARHQLLTAFALGGFLAVSALFFAFGLESAEGGELSVSVVWATSVSYVLPALAALLSMEVWSEERLTGRIDILLTLAIRERDFVLGKFLGSDFTDTPAATDGIFSTGTLAEEAEQMLDEHPQIVELLEKSPKSVMEFLARTGLDKKLESVRVSGLQAAKDKEIAELRAEFEDYKKRSVEALAAAESQTKEQLAAKDAELAALSSAPALYARLATANLDDPSVRRDAVDLARTMLDRQLLEAHYRLVTAPADRVKAEADRFVRLWELFAELLDRHEDYSLNDSYERLRGIAPVANPDFPQVLLENCANHYCRSHQAEVVRHWFLPFAREVAATSGKGALDETMLTAKCEEMRQKLLTTPLAELGCRSVRSPEALRKVLEELKKETD